MVHFGDPDRAGDFPSWGPAGARATSGFRPLGETLARISGLKAKTFAAYDGRVGAAAVHVGLVTDLRLASVQARLAWGVFPRGRFPGMGAYWLPKFVGLGNARRIFLSVRTCRPSARRNSDLSTSSKTPWKQRWTPRSRQRAR